MFFLQNDVPVINHNVCIFQSYFFLLINFLLYQLQEISTSSMEPKDQPRQQAISTSSMEHQDQPRQQTISTSSREPKDQINQSSQASWCYLLIIFIFIFILADLSSLLGHPWNMFQCVSQPYNLH